MISVFKRSLASIAHISYAVYAWFVFLTFLLLAMLWATILPGIERRRRWIAAGSRVFFFLVGIRISISGIHHLPKPHCVVVANHASYIDGVILQAVTPPSFSFVIKGEVRSIPIVHFMLRRVGAKFVERFVAAESSRDARVLLKAASKGESLAFFPEGTFIAKPGLGRFRPGAFAAASKGGLPIVPVAILGSRHILPAKTLLPRPGPLSIVFFEPIDIAQNGQESSGKLAEFARQRILEVLDEPDLLLADSR